MSSAISSEALATLRSRLESYNQGHLLTFFSKLSSEEQLSLYKELNELDLDYLTQSFAKCIAQSDSESQLDASSMTPLAQSQCGSLRTASAEEALLYKDTCLSAVTRGELAILLLAGGQGTRLGVSYPKGMYNLGLPSGKTLFQLQAERILKLQMLAMNHCKSSQMPVVPWYIMTSASTMGPTRAFFEQNNFFGLKSAQVVLFEQNTLPCFDFQGRMIMATPATLARAPDGNGGLYRSLREHNILEDMKRRGVKYIQSYCVDNVLVRVGDPLFTGYCIAKGAECGNKVVRKEQPDESVGITCMVDKEFKVVEYSEIGEEVAALKDQDGNLVYWAANLCIHFFSLDFLDKAVQLEHQLVHHVAKKKIGHVNLDSGELVKPATPNGIKMEKFVFDVFAFVQKFVVWECERDEEFAPLKNADNPDGTLKLHSPKHCREMLLKLHSKWVREAGAIVVPPSSNNNEKSDDNDEDYDVIEVSPLLSLAGENLEKIVQGKQICTPCHLQN